MSKHFLESQDPATSHSGRNSHSISNSVSPMRSSTPTKNRNNTLKPDTYRNSKASPHPYPKGKGKASASASSRTPSKDHIRDASLPKSMPAFPPSGRSSMTPPPAKGGKGHTPPQ